MNKICLIEDCHTAVGRHGAKGLCPYHYKRKKAGIPFDQPKQGTFTRKCSYEECTNKHYGHGFCSTHYWRNKSKGGLRGSFRVQRNFIVKGDSLLVPLGVEAKDGCAVVDPDMKHLEEHKWSLSTRGYATTNIDGKSRYLHHSVLAPKDSLVVNHKNENKLDNRKDNLELVERWQNNTFKSTFPAGSSGHRGVTKDARNLSKPYLAYIQRGNKRYKKYFTTIEEAIKCRKEWEIELFGREVL